MITALSPERRAAELQSLPHWRYEEARQAIYRAFSFEDFAQAFAFMARAAIVAEKTDHHPEWSNVYDRVEIWLTTHDAGGVSERDFALAHILDRFA